MTDAEELHMYYKLWKAGLVRQEDIPVRFQLLMIRFYGVRMI